MQTVETLPAGARIHHVRFAGGGAADDVLHELPHIANLRAVVVARDLDPAATVPEGDLLVLQVPTSGDAAAQDHDDADFAAVRAWVDAPHDRPCAIMTTLQGVRIVWTRTRFAVFATPERLPTVCAALAEVTWYEAELDAVERELRDTWPDLEGDIPLAFEFEALPLERRRELRERFKQTMLLVARLARIGPPVHAPHIHPPTLASQVSERLRERTQMMHRHELVSEQVELFQEVYEMCGQRASDFELATKGHTLEKIIIALLLAQLLFWGFDILTTLGG